MEPSIGSRNVTSGDPALGFRSFEAGAIEPAFRTRVVLTGTRPGSERRFLMVQDSTAASGPPSDPVSPPSPSEAPATAPAESPSPAPSEAPATTPVEAPPSAPTEMPTPPS